MLTLTINDELQPYEDLTVEISLMQSPARWSATFESPRGIVAGMPAQVHRDDVLQIDGFVDIVDTVYDGGKHVTTVEGRSASADVIDGNLPPGEHHYEWIDTTLDALALQLLPTYERHPLGRYDYQLENSDDDVFFNPENLEENNLFKLHLIRANGNKELAEESFYREFRSLQLESIIESGNLARIFGGAPRANSPESFLIARLSLNPSTSPWKAVADEASKRSFILYDAGTYSTLWNADYHTPNSNAITEDICLSWRVRQNNQQRFHSYYAINHANSAKSDTEPGGFVGLNLSEEDANQLADLVQRRNETSAETTNRLTSEALDKYNEAREAVERKYAGNSRADRYSLYQRRVLLNVIATEMENAVTGDQLSDIVRKLIAVINDDTVDADTLPDIQVNRQPPATLIDSTILETLPKGPNFFGDLKQIVDTWRNVPPQEDITSKVVDANIRKSRTKIFYQAEQDLPGHFAKIAQPGNAPETQVDLQQKTVWEAKLRAAASLQITAVLQGHSYEVGETRLIDLPFAYIHHSRLISHVKYMQDDQGQRTELTLVRTEQVEPFSDILPDGEAESMEPETETVIKRYVDSSGNIIQIPVEVEADTNEVVASDFEEHEELQRMSELQRLRYGLYKVIPRAGFTHGRVPYIFTGNTYDEAVASVEAYSTAGTTASNEWLAYYDADPSAVVQINYKGVDLTPLAVDAGNTRDFVGFLRRADGGWEVIADEVRDSGIPVPVSTVYRKINSFWKNTLQPIIPWYHKDETEYFVPENLQGIDSETLRSARNYLSLYYSLGYPEIGEEDEPTRQLITYWSEADQRYVLTEVDLP